MEFSSARSGGAGNRHDRGFPQRTSSGQDRYEKDSVLTELDILDFLDSEKNNPGGGLYRHNNLLKYNYDTGHGVIVLHIRYTIPPTMICVYIEG